MKKDSAVMEITRHKAAGKTVVGCFPLYPPVELFTAMGLLPVVLWNLEKDVRGLKESDRHLQNYACAIARELTGFVLTDAGTCLDGIFSYNACDTLRNLPEILSSATTEKGRPVPMLRMHLPQVNRNHTDPESYLKGEIGSLIRDIGAAFNLSLSAGAFGQAAEAYARMRQLCMDAEALVARGAISFSDFSRTVLAGYVSPVDTQIRRLADLIAKADLSAGRGHAGVLISGIMPPPASVIRAMEAAGLRVVANDIASLRRSYGYTPAATDDPGAYYTELYAKRFPCSTLLYQTDARANAFLDLVASSGAKGVVFSGEKFCEYEYFEFPYLENRLREKGIPTLRLEFGVDDEDNTESFITRIEAFGELMI